MKKIQKIKIYFFITFFFLFFDILLSQFFLLDLITKNREISHKEDIQNRIHNKDYKYTFSKNILLWNWEGINKKQEHIGKKEMKYIQ